jgi:hypothetical protein
MTNTDTFSTLDASHLDTVAGGNGWANAGRFLGRAAGKLAWPVTAGMAAWDGYQGYSQARARGASVQDSLGAGAQNAASGLTFGLIPAPR